MKKHKESRSTVPAPVRRRDSVDILERVLTRGAQVKGVDTPIDEETNDDSATGESAWLHVTLAGIDLVNVQTDLSWRPWEKSDESRSTTE